MDENKDRERQLMDALGIPPQLQEFIMNVQAEKLKEGLEVSAAEILDQLVLERSQLSEQLQQQGQVDPRADTGGAPPYYEGIEDIGLDLARINKKDIYSTLTKSILNRRVPLFDPNKMELLLYLKAETGVDIFDTLAFGRAALSRGYDGVGTEQIVDLYRKVGATKKDEAAKTNFVMRHNKQEV